MDLNASLALANALLSVVSILCAVTAVRAIRRKRAVAHRNLMLTAVSASALFMASFVYRFVRFGFAPFQGSGPRHWLYVALLFSHEPLAVVSLPLVLATLGLGLARRVSAHKEVAQLAYPIWLYSLGSGVALYVLLYA